MDSHVHVRAISSNRVAGAVVGACYVLIGIAGLTLTATTGFAAAEGVHLLIFQLNPLHNVLHLVLGTALGLAAYRGLRHAMLVNGVVGACFGALGVLGLFLLDAGMNPLALNGADNVLHLSSAVILLVVSAARR
ncbi:DUF4383 domain-containing protein [Haloechinothrix halophila]|uniref:DUF4383 domain-containing protein n=1 Tax=Haloechinothrix halophila TaxID=1069073 RepID=UPI000424657F|nr:DUF4383 domain-containing protein [Haloechinothrix halophila]